MIQTNHAIRWIVIYSADFCLLFADRNMALSRNISKLADFGLLHADTSEFIAKIIHFTLDTKNFIEMILQAVNYMYVTLTF